MASLPTRNKCSAGRTTDDDSFAGPWFLPAPPAFAAPPPDLPEAGDLAFDVAAKKRDIFNQARDAIRHSAQYTKHGRKPWTQITVRLPVSSTASTPDEDLAVVYRLMEESTRNKVKVNANGDRTWALWGDRFLRWLLGDDHETMRPMDKYVHPINFQTGEVERKRLEKRLAKEGPSEGLDREMQKLNASAAKDHGYRWANYEECLVTFKKKQPRKEKLKEVQLTVKVRTYVLGSGDPRKHGGFMEFSDHNLRDMDPSTRIYQLMQSNGHPR